MEFLFFFFTVTDIEACQETVPSVYKGAAVICL